MATLNLLLSPEHTVLRRGETDVAAGTAGAHKRNLGTILLSEVGRLDGKVLRDGLQLLELELVDAGGDEGQEHQGCES